MSLPRIERDSPIPGQYGPRDQRRVDNSLGETDRRWERGHHRAQTRSKLVIEHLCTRPPRNPWRNLFLEPRSARSRSRTRLTFRWLSRGLVQLPPRLSSLVPGRVSHPETLDLLRQRFAGLGKMVPSSSSVHVSGPGPERWII